MNLNCAELIVDMDKPNLERLFETPLFGSLVYLQCQIVTAAVASRAQCLW